MWIVASNCYAILDKVPKIYHQVVADHGIFFSIECYSLELVRAINSTAKHNVMIPKNEHSALMYFFIGYYLQLNSSYILCSSRVTIHCILRLWQGLGILITRVASMQCTQKVSVT